MTTIVFDIETVGVDFNQLDAGSQAALMKNARTEEDQAEVKNSLGLYPLTGMIVAIAMIECESGSGAVFFQSPDPAVKSFQEDATAYTVCTEREILENFWRRIRGCQRFVTFNGRGFDCPYISIRSGILRVKPTRDLMPYRYDARAHVDLFDQLTFYGSFRRGFSLHMWTQAFGIKSPKSDGVSGDQVQDLFRRGEGARIARYCMADVQATRQLYDCWQQFIKVEG
ncbi:MAG: ribonuclease H-like domain-containing protein [Candidatus Omnitrophica bacterium]|nr:ribonuclease H-like domain-containing protein [Candidatus Omnitrophota bacterium]